MQKLILVDCNSHAPVKQQVHNQDNPFQVPVVHVQSTPCMTSADTTECDSWLLDRLSSASKK